ncbi:GDSL-like Lipase/Acylhydrolase family [Proteiniphilum saccharofermentans]|uniref:GDSL-like Lipase/Acylhydrolase family n=1 Tax=Proteiniphilum saccharofermentans TaxID=1642647 RepID=A0A1R3T5Y7_9BACT|nr:SGNH/GDSL hydrolase family protein [Proteiniphilum saccharofermentans]SCD19967.1 GDSL-like Lipase/Acylhydrolase family [Proteiniphilum saccharofermentans]
MGTQELFNQIISKVVSLNGRQKKIFYFFLKALSTVCFKCRGSLNYNFAKKSIVLILAIPFTGSLFAQTNWCDPLKENYNVIQNQGWTNEIGKTYQRLPDRAEDEVRKPVWNLSQNSAGLAIHFYTNAEKIEIRYGVTGNLAMSHMPATGVSGVDLYAIDPDGIWRLATGKYTFNDTITYSYEIQAQNQFHKSGFEYRLYLPLYNSVKWMEIGVPDSAEFKFIPTLKEKPIMVYGTSIAQGGCASRPGMGWTNILSRKLDYPVINLAFSGNGPLEKELVDLIDEIDASLYIYDCLPNMGSLSSEEVVKRTIYGVSKIREKHDTPILLVDHIGYRNQEMNNASKESGDRMNSALKSAYDSLVNQGVKNIYHLRKDMIDFPEDGCVDNIHPNDLGMQAYANAYEKIIREILNMPAGDFKITKPVSQRREPHMYEWKARHENILQSIQLKHPKRVIIGNSITHYWGGTTERENGSQSWKKQMDPAGYLNLGYGWDRIENVLWRVYHGELSGYDAEEVILMIGTNNLGLNTDDEIVKGLRFLLRQIRIRQPNAKIKVMGLLPRRGYEDHVKAINKHITKMVLLHDYIYLDVGDRLLLENGKIDETLFSDGLHPNEEGYARIVDDIIIFR